ncbi:MAG: hypothetical protein QNK19_02560 [Xanthomonadales bacterium]|nr:hypothetical protein [Xanthomonadales bacterium]
MNHSIRFQHLLVITIFVLSLNVTEVQAQICTSGVDGEVTLSSQQQVNDFQANYGPCTVMGEGLSISGPDISDLTPLSELVEAQYWLSIRDNPQLASLQGLDKLERVNIFELKRNRILPDLAGLGGLVEVWRDFSLVENDALRTLSGISPSVSFNYYLSISSNPVLENISALENSYLAKPSNVVIFNNSKLSSLVGLPTIEQLTELIIERNDTLTTLEGIVANNGELTGRVSIQNNFSLTSFEGLEWLESIDSMTVFRNPKLKNFRGLSGLTSIKTKLIVEENNSLEGFTGLEQLRHVGDFPASLTPPSFRGDVWVRYNPSISSLSGLSSLQSVEGRFWLYDLPSLTSLQGLNKVSHLGSLSVSTNPLLSDLGELPALRSVRDIGVNSNKILSDCQALIPLLDVIDHDKPGPGPSEYDAPDISGGVFIENNAVGCNSKEQIAPKPDITKVMTGSWYSPASAGEGFMIHVVKEHIPNPIQGQAGFSVGYFYGYDEQGQRFWLLGTHNGDMQWDVPIEFKAILATGGVFEGFDTTAIEEIEWGSFSFTPGSCTAGTISMTGEWSNQPGIYEKTLKVVRLGDVAGDYCAQQTPSVMSDSITGSWYDPATSGQGFSIHKITEQTGAVYFYGFDSVGAPLWLLGTWNSPLLAGETVEFEMHRFTGGTFTEVNPGEIVEEPWGTMSLRMDDCGVAYAEMDGLDGKQIFFMQQPAGSLGLECME